jgi:hypothetical protein
MIMDIRPKVRNAALVGALAAITATAWATNEAMTDSGYAPPEQAAIAPASEPLVSEPLATSESLSPNESVAVAAERAPAPVVERTVASAPITIEEQRLTEDQRIQAVVMDRLAQAPNISGKIGVESLDSVVTLSGWTSTAMQADRAARTARGVIGVRYVQNEIRPRIGGSAS